MKLVRKVIDFVGNTLKKTAQTSTKVAAYAGYYAGSFAGTFTVNAIRVTQGLWSRIGGQGIGSRLRYLLPGAHFDYEREAGDTWSNSVVAIALRWVGDNYPRPKIRQAKILRDGSTQPLPRSRTVDLLMRPNLFYTYRVLAKAVSLSLLTDGNAYLIKVRNGIGQPTELWWFPHWMIQPIWPADGSEFIAGYQLLRDYQVLNLRVEDVVHFRDGLDPRNERLGLAAIKAQLREICTDNEIGGYEASLLRNMGVPGVVIKPKAGSASRLDRDQADRLKNRFTDALSGDSRGEPIVLLSGEIELEKIGLSPAEMQLDKLPERSQARICAALGVAPMAVGLPDPGKTYSNLGEAKSAAWNHCIVPLQDIFAETIRWQVLNEFDDPYKNIVEFDYSQINELQEDLGSKHDRIRKDFQADLITRNEARDEMGYDPDPDGDRYFDDIKGDNAPGRSGLPGIGIAADRLPAPSINGNGDK